MSEKARLTRLPRRIRWMGVVDGLPPKGVATAADAADRKAFLRKIGYKVQ